MNQQRNRTRFNRLKIIVRIGSVFLLAVLLVRFVHSLNTAKAAGPVKLACDRSANDSEALKTILPEGQYLITENFGWFDRTHFNTGRPGQLLQDVKTAVANGGGIVTVDQDVKDDILGYTAVYQVTGNLSQADADAVALGIYLDFSIRFEEWQAQLPHLLMAPRTAFAVEDLPSQYLGFFAQAHEMQIEELFACYLGSVSSSAEAPPDFVMSEKTAAIDGWAGIARLQNKTFMPMVETETGWQHVAWPKPMQMEPIPDRVDTWQFLSERTWYWGDQTPDLYEANARQHFFHPRFIQIGLP